MTEMKQKYKIKEYQSSGGYRILVGQEDESNDFLTFSLRHANDFWFHVKGVPGSHVILCCGESGEKPDKESIRDAASLAAYFSKMREGGNVTVSYCLAKQVRKPRGAKVGTVNISKAMTIKVRPALLEEII